MYYYYTYPTYSYDFAPSYHPQPSYPGVSLIPSVPNYPGNLIPGYPSGFPQNPNRPPIEVEDPADNAPADIIQGGNANSDDDTVTIEALRK